MNPLTKRTIFDTANTFKYNISKEWEPTQEDFSWANILITIEAHNPRSLPRYFSALIYCITTLRETFNKNEEQFNQFLYNELFEPEDIIANQNKVKNIFSNYGFAKMKSETVINAAYAWRDMQVEQFMFNDPERLRGKELRSEITKNIKGVGLKLTSLLLRMGGYENTVPIDSTYQAYLESKGHIFQKRLSSGKKQGLKEKPYLLYEEAGEEIATNTFQVMPTMLQAAVYTAQSSWKKDSGAENISYILKWF